MQDDEEPPVERIPPPKPRSPQMNLAYVCLFAGALVLMWWMTSHNSPRVAAPVPTRATQPARMGDLLVGEHGRVDTGGNIVFIAVDDAAFDALNTAANADDTAGMRQLVAAGRVFTVERNTGILVIENGVFSVRVRVTDGPQSGKSGWIAAEFVKR